MTETRKAESAASTRGSAPFGRLFVTGGSGFLGRNLIRHFVGRGVLVTALARSDRSMELVRKLGLCPIGGIFSATIWRRACRAVTR